MNKKTISNSVSIYISKIIPVFKKLNKKKNVQIGLAGVSCAVILILVVCMVSRTEVYSLSINGKAAGYVTDKTAVKQAVSEITDEYTKGKNRLDLNIDEDSLVIKSTDLKKQSVTALTDKDLKKAILTSDICTVQGWAISVDSKNVATVASEKSADQILANVKSHYLTSGSNVISVDFKENVIVTQAAVGISDLVTTNEAVTLILTGEKAVQTYTVKDGDTLWDIAAGSGMSVTELQNANPGFDPNKLKIGQQLNMVAIKPYVTVATKEQMTWVEPIDFQTVYEQTSSLYIGEVKLKTAGANGTKQINAEVTKENGVILASNVLESKTLTEPQDAVALKGTKSNGGSVGRGGGRTISVDASGSEIVAYAKQFIGTPYVHGGSSSSGFDCSGFTSYVFSHFGGSLPRTASGQFSCGNYVERSDLQPGDLVFFTRSSSSSRISHVGIYVGNGCFIHSPQQGDSVKISSFSTTSLHYAGAVRAN
jgi:cell wall-associated NlpC family hydrolase